MGNTTTPQSQAIYPEDFSISSEPNIYLNRIESIKEIALKNNRLWVTCLLLGLAYFGIAYLGQLAAIPPDNVTLIGLSSGLALIAFLLLGPSIWPGIFLGALFTTIWPLLLQSDLTTVMRVIVIGVGIGLSTCLQAYIGAFLIHRYQTVDYPLSVPKDVIKFFFIVAKIALINATFGTLLLIWTEFIQQDQGLFLWLTWWMGDVVGMIVVTSLVISYFARPIKRYSWTKILESLLLTLILLIFLHVIFVYHYPFLFAIIPFLLWATFRLEMFGSNLVNSIIAIFATWKTTHHEGPIAATTSSLNEALLILQIYIAFIFCLTLIIDTLNLESQKNKQALEIYNRNLEQTISQRTNDLQTQLQQLRMLQKKIVTQEKLASLGALAAGIAHEMRNPLNFIVNFSSLCIENFSEILSTFEKHRNQLPADFISNIESNLPLLEENLAEILEQSYKADRIVQGMLQHARSTSGTLESIVLSTFIDRTIDGALALQTHRELKSNLKIDRQYDPNLNEITIVPQDFSKVLMNLLDNAFYSVFMKYTLVGPSYQPQLTIKTELINGEKVAITIHDNGMGIPPTVQEKLFQPFMTTKPPGIGTGLGLSISYDIIVLTYQGEIKVDTKEGEYAAFTIILPYKPSFTS